MRYALGVWTALCLLVVVITLFTAPGWDTSDDIISGSEIFAVVLVLTLGAWIVGSGMIAAAGAVLRVVDRRFGRRASFGLLGACVVTALVLGVAVGAAQNHHERSSFVSFGTVDADPDWSPDGQWIAFATTRGDGGIYVIHPDGTGIRSVFQGTANDVDWSPDGKRIAFAGVRGLYVLRIDTARPKLVLRGDGYSLPAWSPNGRDLAVVKNEPGVFALYGGGSFKSDAPAIYVARLDGTRPRRLLRRYEGAVGAGQPGSVAAVSETNPAWSPDGTRIAFQAGDGEIVVADVATGHRVSVGGGYEPAWSPDGRLLAYQCYGDLCVADASGSWSGHRIASSGGDPSWSRDSRFVVFERYLYGGSGWGSHPQSLAIVSSDGEDYHDLTYGPQLP